MRKVLFVALFAIMAAPFAFAASSNGTLTVNAAVAKTCTIDSPTLAFGTYDTFTGAALDANVNFSVQCTKGAAGVFITLGQGANADPASTDAAPLRRLNLGAEYLNYNLFASAADRTAGTVWNNVGGVAVAAPASKNAFNVPVYGRVAASQDVSAGTYTDSVQATINF